MKKEKTREAKEEKVVMGRSVPKRSWRLELRMTQNHSPNRPAAVSIFHSPGTCTTCTQKGTNKRRARVSVFPVCDPSSWTQLAVTAAAMGDSRFRLQSAWRLYGYFSKSVQLKVEIEAMTSLQKRPHFN